jgi:spoIIIJ-associated protein
MPLTDEQQKTSVELITRMLQLLGYEVEASVKDSGDEACISLKTPEPGRIIGRKGHSLQSIELLLNRMMRRSFAESPWIDVDVDGYEKKRRRRGRKSRQNVDEDRLTRMALDTAKEVKRWGQPKRIGPFNAAERRIIHMTLREDDEISTESEEAETEGQKRVVVKLV